MGRPGHHHSPQGRSVFRVFAPEKQSIGVYLPEHSQTIALSRDALGYWHGETEALAHGTLYWIEVDGTRLPDPASCCQPQGVHGASMVVRSPGPVHSTDWTGVPMADAIIYELHLGTFTPEGTLAAAQARLPYLRELGINVIELLPIAAFPGQRNWGYDGTFQYALQHSYGDHADLKRYIEAAHEHGIAVILDVVYNHFGPEGNYTGAYAPYTKAAATPWGAAINFDGDFNYGVREYFLENTRYWLQEIGFDGFRMDAVSLIFDLMPEHILREFTDLARQIGAAEGREVLMIAEHLRNNRHVTAERGFNYHAQWNDDLNHAIYARLTGETGRHYVNFGSFDDVVKALRDGFVLDGTRLDQHYRYLLGTDGRLTEGHEHVVHMQNHDQVGNRLLGDRMIRSHGQDKALLAITAVMASPFVPMLFMGEEYGETAPFLFFEDFSDPLIIDGAREGRKADFSFGGIEPDDPHAIATFEKSKLRWPQCDAPQGRQILAYYRALIALKRSGALGPRRRGQVQVSGDALTQIITIETPQTLVVLNFSGQHQPWSPAPGADAAWELALASIPDCDAGWLAPYAAVVLRRGPATAST
jgi:maltooligosyltrehalose trehalohydrolase